MNLTNRSEHDRRACERRTRSVALGRQDRRAVNRRGYLDRRTAPEWQRRWLRDRVISALR